MAVKRVHVYVTGRVQGVFFRAETSDMAKQFGVHGWVRNLPDGRVEAVFEGEENSLERMLEFCHSGPPGARVSHVHAKWEDPKHDITGFRILH